MSYDAAALRAALVESEGDRRALYFDTEGVPTWGIGHNCQKPLSPAVRDLWFAEDVAEAEAALDALEPRWRTLSGHVQLVLVEVAFNLGRGRFSQFRRFWQAMRDFIDSGQTSEDALRRAAAELRDSKAARQTGTRYARLAERLLGA